MKKLFKLFSVLLAFCLSFSLAGCGKPPEQQEDDPSLTTQQVVTKIHDLINFDDLNFTITGNGDFEISYKSFGEPKTTIGYSVEDMIIKVANNNTYFFIPEYGENYQIGDYEYSNEYEFNEDENTYELGDFFITKSYGFFENSDIDVVMQDLFYDMFSFNSDWVSSEKQSDGGYKLSLNVDVKEIFDDIKLAFEKNLNKPIINIVNDILAIFYSDLTVESLVADLKGAINAESTIQDLFDFIEAELNLKLTNIINLIFAELSYGEFGGYDFTENFYEYFDIANDAAFASMLDGVVTTLSDDEYTIQKILDAFDLIENGDADPADVEEAEDYLDNAPDLIFGIIEIYHGGILDTQINDLIINFSITTNSEVDKISNLTLSIKSEICEEDYLTVGYDINFDFKVSNVGTTQVSLPDNFEICGIDMCFYIETELNANEEYVYENINFGDNDLEFLYDDCLLNYNAADKTLTLSSETVNYLLDFGNITFEDGYDFTIIFYYTFGVVE